LTLKCPKGNFPKEKRISQWKEQIKKYISNPYLVDLLALFGYKHKGEDLEEQLKNLSDFVNANWDFRKMSGSGERWTIEDRNQFVLENEPKIIEAADQLGMIHHKENLGEFDYIISLGGARAATYERIEEAFAVWENQGKEGSVIALVGMRPLGEIEVPYVESFMEEVEAGTTTEYDVACSAMEKLFSVKDGIITGENKEANPNSRWQWRTYQGAKLAVLCAPSSCPEKRRANSRDTFVYFLNKYSVPSGSRILFVTSSIYINYQLSAFIDLAVEYGFEIVFCGAGEPGRRNPVVSNYLQEIKGSIDAICNSLERLS